MSSALMLPAALFGVLLFVGCIKARRFVRILAWVSDNPDRMLRRLLGASLVPGIAVAIALAVRGLAPPASLAVGAIFMLGVFTASSGVLGVEGGLTETGLEAKSRVAQGLSPNSTTLGRIVAVATGSLLVAGATALTWWTTGL